MMDWRKTEDGVGWGDDLSRIELRDKDGRVVIGFGFVGEAWDGEDEWPLPSVRDKDGNELLFQEFYEWRPAPVEGLD